MKSIFLIFVCCNFLICFGTADNVMDDIYSKLHQNEYKVIFERSLLHYLNKSMGEFEVKSFIYNRTIKATNQSFLMYDDYNSQELRLLIQARKFLSNEYRLFPLRFETNLCKSINEGAGGLERSLQCGNFTGCPIKKNTKYFFCNYILDSAHFPPLIPTGQYLMESSVLYRTYTMVTLYTYLNIYYESKLVPKDKSRVRAAAKQ